MKYLLDTNVISELVAKRPAAAVLTWIDAIDPNSAYISVVTIGEISRGIEKLPDSSRKTELHRWLRDDLLLRFDQRVLSIDINVMLNWGGMVAKSERLGRPLPAMDSLVAALAVCNSCAIATRNAAHFGGLGVPVFNPWT